MEVNVPKSPKAHMLPLMKQANAPVISGREDENKVASLRDTVLQMIHSPKPLSFTMDLRHKRLLEVLQDLRQQRWLRY